MAILPIYNCFHPVLKQKTNEIEEFNQDLKDFIDNMFQTMYNADGIGLAANQVGDKRSVFIIDTTPSDPDNSQGPIAFINPEIISSSEETIEFQEGCLSVPKFLKMLYEPKALKLDIMILT